MMKKVGSLFIPGLEEYINTSYIPRPHSFFTEIEDFAKEKSIPILSPASGAILAKLIRWLGVQSILELGTGAGYSLHWMVSKADRSISITTMDRNREIFPIVQEYWDRSPYKKDHKVRFQPGHIVEQLENGTIHSLDYDFIFIDSDKVTYPVLIRHFLDKWKDISIRKFKTQFLLFDNVLWHGRVMDPNPQKPSDIALKEFWEYTMSQNLDQTLIPAGDGLLMIELRE